MPHILQIPRKALATRASIGLLAFLLAVLLPSGARGDPDVKSPFDFKKQSALFQKPSARHQCQPAPTLPRKVESVAFYKDARNSEVNPELLKQFRELTKTITDEEHFLSLTNTLFIQAPGEERAAIGDCLLAHMVKIARDGAFIDSDDIRGGGAVRLMSVTPLVTYLLLKEGHRVPNIRDVEIRAWITLLMDRLQLLEKKFRNDANIEDWTAAAYALGAAALDRRDLLDRAVKIVRKKAAMVNEDGVLPLEVARGRMGLTYSLFATQALSIVMEVADANSIDLLEGAAGKPLRRMMKRMVRAINDPKSFLEVTDVREAIEPEHISRANMGWLEIYYDKTKDEEARKALCANLPLYSWRIGGDWHVLVGEPSTCPKPAPK